MGYQNAATAYRENAVLTASPEKLVKLLYEGAIRHMERSRMVLSSAETARSAQAGESIGKAFAIVGELRSSLDHEQGKEIAGNLDRLYEFTLDQLSQANMQRTPQPVEHGLAVMRTLKEGWDAIIPN